MEENKIQNNESKETKPKKKINVLALIVALLLVIFLSANVYATTNGYDNIFFMIKNMFAPEIEQSGEELLSDREIIISYKSIEIMNGIKVQVNKLTLENEKATLHLTVNDEVYYTPSPNGPDEVKNETPVERITPFSYQVFDENENLICEHKSINELSGKYTELLELKDVTIDTKLLTLKIFTLNEEEIAKIEINLETKELILLNAKNQSEKLSEIELKEFLGNVVRVNFFKDKESITEYHTEEEYRNEVKVLYALELLEETEVKEDVVYDVLEELFNTEITEPFNVANIVVTKGNGTFKYVSPNTTHNVHALCLDITNISYLDGIYTAECVYIYPTQEDYDNEEIENLPQYKATVKIKTNEAPKYTKYTVLNIDEMQLEIEEDENVGGDGEGYNEYNTPINISIKNYNVASQYIEGVRYTMSNARVTEEFVSENSDTGFNLIAIPGTTQEYVMNLNYQERDYRIIFDIEYDENAKIKKLWVREDDDKLVGWLEAAYDGTVVNLEILMNVSTVAGWKQTVVPGLQISHPVGWNITTINEEVEGLGTAIREFSCEPDNVSLTMKVYDGEVKVEKLEVVVDEYCKLNPNAKRSEYVLDTREKGGFLWIVACEENENVVTEYYFGKSVGFSDNENKAVFQVIEVRYENYEEADRVQLRVDLLSNMISKSR